MWFLRFYIYFYSKYFQLTSIFYKLREILICFLFRHFTYFMNNMRKIFAVTKDKYPLDLKNNSLGCGIDFLT